MKFKGCLSVVLGAAAALVLGGCAEPNSSSRQVPTYDVSGPAGSSFEPAPVPSGSSESGWPRYVVSGSTTNLIYQPQVDSWDGHQVVARNAVAIAGADLAKPVYGAVTIQATTLVDKTKRTVTLVDIKVLNGDFPSARDKNKQYVAQLQQAFPHEIPGLSLDRLETSFSVAPQQLKGSPQPLNNTPPKILFSNRPAVLVYIDGAPAYRPVPGTDLQRVINTGMLVFKDESGRHYLRLADGYVTAPSLGGPWTPASQLPKGTAEVEREFGVAASPAQVAPQGQASPQAQVAPQPVASGPPPSGSTNPSLPVVYVATTPTELVIFEGEPNFAPIPGTHLLYVANTTANVFKMLTDQKTYILLSGRWFRASSLDGPWEYVAATQLPTDFASIPDASPKENVKASVPGTAQATEALIANSIPQSTKIQRAVQMQDPQIDGPPQLQPIAGTPLYYVANSATPIIKVDENSWYACQSGVWYASTSVNGPWAVAAVIPAVIYTIPPSSPLHYLTYVRIYGSGADYVYEGYTPGYMGTEVEDGVVVYGTGYYYAPWVGVAWYGYPCTWGFGWGPCWNPWYDWCFYWGFGWGCGYGYYGWHYCHPPAPWYGPYRHWGAPPGSPHPPAGAPAVRQVERVSTAGNVYARSTRTGVRGVSGAANSDAYGHAYNSRTGALVAGQRAAPTAYRGLDGSPSRTALSAGTLAAPRGSSLSGGGIGGYGAWGRDGSVAPRYSPNARGYSPGAQYSAPARGSGFRGSPYGGAPGRGSVSGRGASMPSGGGRGGFSGGGRSGGGPSGGGGGGHGGGGSSGGGGGGGHR